MLELTSENFNLVVKEENNLVLVDFYGESCEPCKALLPHIEALEGEFGAVKFTKFNISTDRRLSIKEKVLGVPTVCLYKDGAKVATVTGAAATPEAIKEMLIKG